MIMRSLRVAVLMLLLVSDNATALLLRRATDAATSLGSLNANILVAITRNALPEALKVPDGSVTSTKQVSFSTGRVFYNVSAMAEATLNPDARLISHVTSTGYGEWTENNLHHVISKANFSCLCGNEHCTRAVAADLRGVLNPNAGIHRQASPLILYSPNGEPLPCLSLEPPINLDESQVMGCSPTGGVGRFGELLVDKCEQDTVSSLRIVDTETLQLRARSLYPKEVIVLNAIKEYLPDPRVSMRDLFADITVEGPVTFSIPINEEVKVGSFTVPINVVLEFDASDSMERAGRALVVALLDKVLETLWPTDFDDSNPGSEAGVDEMMRIMYRFAFYGYVQSQHISFEKQESRQLESIGQYLSIKDGRPNEVSVTEIVTNTILLIASASGWAWSISHAVKSYLTGYGFDLSIFATVLGSTIALVGALVVFVKLWKDMRKRLDYSESMIILEVMMFSRTGSFFPGRVFRDFDIASVAVNSVNLQDVSADYTWLFVLGTMLAVTALVVAGLLGWRRDVPQRIAPNPAPNNHSFGRNHWVMGFVICWLVSIVVVPLVLGLSSNNNPNYSTVYSATSEFEANESEPTETPSQSVVLTDAPVESWMPTGERTEIPKPSDLPTILTPPTGEPSKAPLDPTGEQSPASPDPTRAPSSSSEPTEGSSLEGSEGLMCKNCCKGIQACRGNTGFIADGSCNGNYACMDNTGTIESNSCNGTSACKDNKGTIKSGSCSKSYACQENEGAVGMESCLGTSACTENDSEIGDGSCSANYACQGNKGTVGSDACNGTGACKSNEAYIGSRSCSASNACQESTGMIGAGSCTGTSACKSSGGTIGNGSCLSNYACQETESTATIGTGSCTGVSACKSSSGSIGDRSCLGNYACQESTATIGEESCCGTGACKYSTGIIGDDACNTNYACQGL